MSEFEHLDRIRMQAKLLDRNVITKGQFVNEFIAGVCETPIETVAEFASLVPDDLRVKVCKYFREFVDLNYFDTRHMFDPRTHEHKRERRDHYEQVTQRLLELLDCGTCE